MDANITQLLERVGCKSIDELGLLKHSDVMKKMMAANLNKYQVDKIEDALKKYFVKVYESLPGHIKTEFEAMEHNKENKHKFLKFLEDYDLDHPPFRPALQVKKRSLSNR